MDLHAVAALARSEITRAGLAPAWRFVWDRARRRAGLCRYGDRTISLSKPLMALYTEAQVREVLAHEIAHALVGSGHAHDRVWAAQARRLGGSGKAKLPSDSPRPPATWIGTCPHGHRYERYRKPGKASSCSRCHRGYDRRFLIAWRPAA